MLTAGVFVENVRRFKAHPQSAPGDFYVVNGECVSCGAPHAVAPDLIGWAKGTEHEHCVWKKQPETYQEMEQALAAFDVSEVGCYRYAGCDPTVMKRIGLDCCDQAVIRPEQIERRAESDNSSPEIHFSLTASNQSSIWSRLKGAVARLGSKFGT
jgi:hypothetical protein